MAGKIQIPVNLEDQAVLKRFLTNLVLNFNTNPLITGTAEEANAALSQAFGAGAGDRSFLDTLADIADVQTKIKTYVEQNVETLIKQNTQNIALVAEQFGTFYNDALAASWYGLSVKAGGTVAGLEVGSLDPNTTTPGDESSYFRISADSFLVGRAYEDLSQEEKDYLAANNLPNFGTVYSAEGDPIPAFVIDWDSNTQQYNIFFNGRVQFSNLDNVPEFAYAESLADYLLTSTYATDQLNIQNQIDNKAESYYQESTPHPEGVDESYAIWVGDIWKIPSTNKEYIYQLVNGTYSWVETDVPDQVYDTIDGKAAIYVSSSLPDKYLANDLLIVVEGSLIGSYLGGDVLTASTDSTGTFNLADWSKIIKDTDYAEWLVNTYATDQLNIQNQIDGQIETWFYNGEPTLLNIPASGWTTNEEKNNHLGDLYYDKLTGYGYRFAYEDIEDNPDQGIIYSWIRIQDTDVTLALATASKAQETADGKITTFYTASTPTAEGNGDIWINSDTEIQKIWDGSTWVTLDTAKAINSGTTTINGGRITTGSIEAAQLSATAVTADKINTGVLYNLGGNAASYTMKIDFNNGEIHIK